MIRTKEIAIGRHAIIDGILVQATKSRSTYDCKGCPFEAKDGIYCLQKIARCINRTDGEIIKFRQIKRHWKF